MNDLLGERIKNQYEDRTRYSLPRRTYTLIRIDGKAFHTFARGFKRPFDHELMELMDKTAAYLCTNIQGAVVGYVQSDEISILLSDFTTPQTDAWFDGNIQKMVSVSASMATAAFNKQLSEKQSQAAPETKFFDKSGNGKIALFDSRVFTVPDHSEVENYFIWRQADAVRNSIQSAAQSVYSQKQLHGKNTSELQELLFQKGINWNDYLSGEKRGRAIVKEQYLKIDLETTGPKAALKQSALRTRWVPLTGKDGNETPIFTADKTFLRSRIPLMGEYKNDK